MILGVGLIAALAAFGFFEWQQNTRIRSERMSIREKLAEAESALRANSALRAGDTEESPSLRNENASLRNRLEALRAELAAVKRSQEGHVRFSWATASGISLCRSSRTTGS